MNCKEYFDTQAKSKIVEDFSCLLNDSELSDVVFVFPKKENKKIFAHKNILFARCELFDVMFKIGMKESIKNEIEITNFEYDTFYALLKYIYTGELHVNSNRAVRVLEASDLYSLPHLKVLCEKKLEKYITKENVCSILEVSHCYKATLLFSKAVKYVIKQYKVVSESQAYDKMPLEIKEIIQSKRRNKDEQE